MKVEDILVRNLPISVGDAREVLRLVSKDRAAALKTRNPETLRRNAASRVVTLVLEGKGNTPLAQFWAHLSAAETSGSLQLGSKTYLEGSGQQWYEAAAERR